MAPDRPSHVRTQEGHCDSDPQLASETSEGRRLEDDARRLLELTHERQPKEIDIPEASAKFEPSVFSTEKVRYFDSDLHASEAFEDQRLKDDSLRLVELTHGRQPKEIDIPEGSAKFEPSTLSTEERRNTVAEPLSQVDNPDDAHEECGNPLLQFIRGFEGALHAHKGPLPTLPSTTGLEERREDMVKITAQKGNSSRDFPTNDDVAQPVHGGAPDLNNIIKEVATPSTDGQEPPSGPRIGSEKILQTVRDPKNAMMGAPIHNVGDSDPGKGTQLVVLSLGDGMGRAALPMQEAAISLSRYCTVEPNAKARAIAPYANPKTDHFPGVDHSLASDINDITEKDIAAVPRNSIKRFVCGPECADFSKLRLLPGSGSSKPMPERGKYIPYSSPRKGLGNEMGKTFQTCIQILWGWVKKHHPDAQCTATVNMVPNGNIIDSGANKHVCKDIETEDAVRSTSLRAGRHERPATKGHNQGFRSANTYAALQVELQYDDQGRQIDDGQEWQDPRGPYSPSEIWLSMCLTMSHLKYQQTLRNYVHASTLRTRLVHRHEDLSADFLETLCLV